MSLPELDVAVIGSGPAGVQAAAEVVRRGYKVALLDIGHRDDTADRLSAGRAWSEIRASDPHQAELFLGPDPARLLERIGEAGTHLTPAREHMLRLSKELFPVEPATGAREGFVPLESTSLGGLGAAWGANTFVFGARELELAGLPDLSAEYRAVVEDIGVSGPSAGDLAAWNPPTGGEQPPAEIDSNASSVLAHYERARGRLNEEGVHLGVSRLALLTRALGEREATRYRDMDFWDDCGRSVYRPRFTVEALSRMPGFHHLPGRRVDGLAEDGPGVRIQASDLRGAGGETLGARRVILAAGALGSPRTALASLGAPEGTAVPILCNPNRWVAAIHSPMLGRAARDRRHSLSQLTACHLVPGREEQASAALFYSYRSLLLFRLLRELPFPLPLGVLFLRACLTALTLVNLHFCDAPSPLRTLRLAGSGAGGRRPLRFEVGWSDSEREAIAAETRVWKRTLRSLRCLPLHVTHPPHGASIHYAGTLPRSDSASAPWHTDDRARLIGLPRVFVADSSTWKFLPAKGPTLTIMAHARRVAARVCEELADAR